MKKLLFVMTTLYNGGAERSLVNLLAELPKDRYQIDLLLFKKKGMFLKELPENVHLLDGPKELQMMYGMLRPPLPLKIRRYFGEVISRAVTSSVGERKGFRWKHIYSHCIKALPDRYDVAVAYISGEVLYYIDEKVQADRKIVWIHNDYRSALFSKKYDEPYLKRVDAIVSISNLCVDILKEEFPELADKMYMLENITSSRALRARAQAFVPREFEKDGNNLLSVGRLSRQKGYDLAVEAAAKLREKNIAFQWYVLGDGEEEKALKKQIVQQKLEGQFHLLGPRENPYPYIKNSTMVVQPSRFEGKSVVLDEAKILGIPIVATSYPTVGDQIKDGREGLIAPMTPEGIAEKIEELLNSPEKYGAIKDWLSSHEYGNQEEVKKYMELFDKES